MSRSHVRAMVTASALALLVVSGWRVTVYATDAGAYADSVDQALQVLRAAAGDDRAAARRAASILERGTGQSQPEILRDLARDPPDIADARDRLAALSVATRSPAFAPEPSLARRATRDILSQPRYTGLSQGPTLADRIKEALLSLLFWLLSSAVTAGETAWLLFVGVGGLLLLTVIAAVGRSNRWRGRREARERRSAAATAGRRDHFAEADRLAALADYQGATRELAEGVAQALVGDRAWHVSPLTVREIFHRAKDPVGLRPLLAAFEASAYGGQPPDRAAYVRVAEAASPFRVAGMAAA